MSAQTTTAVTADAVEDWRELAMCRQVDPELFFPEANSGRAYEAQVAAAKRVCAACPVHPECLSFALRSLGEGIAGGLTPEERRGLPRPPVDRIAALVETARTAANRRERSAAGRALLAAGRPAREVAQVCGVCEETARRWAVLAGTETREVSA